jgi:hypothetical protein
MSFMRWATAAPAMIVIEPRATNCMVMASRSLLQSLANSLGLRTEVVKIIDRYGHGTVAFRLEGNLLPILVDAFFGPDHLSHFLKK